MTLFAPSDAPRVFALPPGADFLAEVIAGLRQRSAGLSPLVMADVTIYLNTRRAERRFRDLLTRAPVAIAPRLRVLGQIGDGLPDLPPERPAQERRLDLAQLVRALIRREPTLASPAAAFELAESLATLLAELQMEGVPLAALEALEAGPQAAHWERSLSFLRILAPLVDTADPEGLDAEARFRAAVALQSAAWAEAPPDAPVLVVGSTGSRGATSALMAAVARLPQGAVILPGFDPDLPVDVRARLGDARSAADHPQYGLGAMLARLGLAASDVQPWTAAVPPAPGRNALVSLALRPAPVTDQWLAEGPALAASIPAAMAAVDLVEAADTRREAVAVAVAMRRALAEGRTAALVTPDRALARRVAAALDHWGLIADDSAGRPLALTAPGILLRRMAEAMQRPPSPVAFLALLRHPLTATGADRGRHLLLTSTLEVEVLREGAPVLSWPRLEAWAAARGDGEAADWVAWLARVFRGLDGGDPEAPLADLLARHVAACEALSAGPGGGVGALWQDKAGDAARRVFDQLGAAAAAAAAIPLRDYPALLSTVLNAEDVQERPFEPHPDLAIWGTLEARTQTADVMILGGLNEGTWPRLPRPDPWLSREMRLAAGLPLPERQIGLSAHDFQQAMGSRQVILTRAMRGDDGAPTVAARWWLRIENLMNGLGAEASAACDDMRARGRALLALAEALERPRVAIPPAPRPAPRPPLGARPERLSVTRIETLIRDPYAVYCSHILRLRRLDPPGRAPSQLERGEVSHKVLERFVEATRDGLPPDAEALFDRIMDAVLEADVPWPHIRQLWRARLAGFRPVFLATEAERRRAGEPLVTEATGARVFDDFARPLTLTARADRIDISAGVLRIYDYKGSVPSKGQVETFAKQLPLTALIAEAGGFAGIPAAPVDWLELIETKAGGKTTLLQPTPEDHGETYARFCELMAIYHDPASAYPARIRPRSLRYASDYDQLSRLGEWEDGDPIATVDVP